MPGNQKQVHDRLIRNLIDTMNAQSGKNVSFLLPGWGTTHNPGNRFHEIQITPNDALPQ